MEDSTNRLVQAVKHYQDSLEKHTKTGNTEKILHAIEKLSRLPIQVCHLEQTGVGKTVNSLKKIEGKVSENARNLVDKWKSMVKGEEEKAKQEALKNARKDDSADDDDDDDDDEDNDSDDHDEKSLQICEDEAHSGTDKGSDSNESHGHKSSKSNRNSQRSRSKDRNKQHSKRPHSSDEDSSCSSSDHSEPKHKSKKHKSHSESTKSSHKKHSESSDSDDSSDSEKSSSDRKSSHKGRSRKSSSESSRSEDSDNSSVERKYKKSNKDKKYSSSSSESEGDREKDKVHSRKDKSDSTSHKHRGSNNSDRKHAKSKESSEDSRKHHDHHKSSGSNSKSKDIKRHKEKYDRDTKKDSNSSKDANVNDRKSEKEKLRTKNNSDSRHSHNKPREIVEKSDSKKSGTKSEKEYRDSKMMNDKKRERQSSPTENSNKKYKESKEISSSQSSKAKEKKDNVSSEIKKEKKERSDSKDRSDKKNKECSNSSSKSSKQDKSKGKTSKPVGKLVNGIDSESGTSFADALGMLEPTVYGKSKKKLNGVFHDKVKVSMEKPLKSTEKPQKSIETFSKPSTSTSSYLKGFSDDLKLLKEPNLEPLDINLSCLLPSITPNYKPIAFPLDNQSKKIMSEDEALTRVISAKHQRTKVYSGNKTGYTKVPSLFDMCSRILQDNIDALEYTGGVPYSILKPILEKATPDQLFQLEFHNPYLIEDTDELWTLHCQKDFRNKKREEMETAREMYMRCLDEREAKLKALTANIKQAQDKSLPVRTTKLAYVDSVAKPPRNVARKQAKNGTLVDIKKPSQTPSERLNQLAKTGEAGKVAVPNPGRVAVERSSSSHSHSSNLKPKKAPLMAKTLSLLKSHFSRR